MKTYAFIFALFSLTLISCNYEEAPSTDFEVFVANVNSTNDFKSISTQIKDAREDKGISKYELGKAVGLSEENIIKIERGVAEPTREILFEMQEYLDTEIVINSK